MVQTTPGQKPSPRCSCPHPPCRPCTRLGAGTLGHRSWTGQHTHLDGRRCPVCTQAFSERAGTWRARSKVPEEPVARLVHGQRWGVWDAGTAAMGAVARQTVPRLQPVAAPRAAPPQRHGVPAGDGAGVPVEEAQATLRPHQGAWSPPALAMGSWFLLWGAGGPRPHAPAAAVLAQVVARGRRVPLFLPAGWPASRAAWLQVVGSV